MTTPALPDHDEVTPRLLATGAVGFWEASKSLLALDGVGLFHWPALFVNLNYAVELSLKCWIMARSQCNEAQLKLLGHDLAACLRKAEAHGYRPPEKLAALIAILGPHHKAHTLRYLRGRSMDMPLPDEAVQIVFDHLKAVGVQLPIQHLPR